MITIADVVNVIDLPDTVRSTAAGPLVRAIHAVWNQILSGPEEGPETTTLADLLQRPGGAN